MNKHGLKLLNNLTSGHLGFNLVVSRGGFLIFFHQLPLFRPKEFQVSF